MIDKKLNTGVLAEKIANDCKRLKKEQPELTDKEVLFEVMFAHGFINNNN